MGTEGIFFPFLVAHGIIRHGYLIEKGKEGKAPSARIHSSPRAFPSCARERKRESTGVLERLAASCRRYWWRPRPVY